MRNNAKLKNRKTGRRRGSVILMFLVVAWPLFILAGALALDYSRIVIVTRQVNNITESAALAGTQEFQQRNCDAGPGIPCFYYENFLNRSAALNATNAYLQQARSLQNAGGGLPPETTFNVLIPQGNPREVTVSTTYTISDLLFVRYFFPNNTFTNTVTRTSFVCSSQNAGGPTEGNCTRPPAEIFAN